MTLRKHCIILELRFFQWGSIGSDKNELRLAGSQGLDGGLKTERVLSRFHHQREARIHILGGLLLTLDHFVAESLD